MDPIGDDPRIRAVLEGPGPFHQIEHHAEVTSTQDVALERLRAGAPAGLVVTADRQRRGRGRRGRVWLDPAADDASGSPSAPVSLSVTATVVCPPRYATLTPLVAGLAVAAAFEAAGATAELKWPNDVLLGGRKAAGILVERHTVHDEDVLAIGCGLDLDLRAVPDMSGQRTWTSLAAATGQDVDRRAILATLLDELGRRVGELKAQPTRSLQVLRETCSTLGQQVAVTLPGDRTLRGRAIDLADEGQLVVATDTGEVTVTAGDVVHLRPAS